MNMSLGGLNCRNHLLETLHFKTFAFILGSLSMRLYLFIDIIRIEFQISSSDNCKFIFNGTCVWVDLETVLRMLFNSHPFKSH